MAAFQYIIKDVKGARSEGIIKATSLDEAVDKLTAEGNTVISVKTDNFSNPALCAVKPLAHLPSIGFAQPQINDKTAIRKPIL